MKGFYPWWKPSPSSQSAVYPAREQIKIGDLEIVDRATGFVCSMKDEPDIVNRNMHAVREARHSGLRTRLIAAPGIIEGYRQWVNSDRSYRGSRNMQERLETAS